jgi:glycosidase
MRRFTKKLWAALLLLLVSMQSMATDVFTSNRTDFRDESIYFMITTRFYDGDPKNNVLCWDNQAAQIETKDPCWRGDFQGVIDKLDYIKALGFTAIWITPVVQNASGYDYHGYHAMDFQHVDCRYQSGDGSKSGDVMFQELIDKAHAKGIKIILDIVLNHTGNFGEEKLCKLFDRDTQLRNQAYIDACMTPTETLGSDYLTILPKDQYQRRLTMMKNMNGQNQDIHNYWHHFGMFGWDDPSRWWGQIAGDCVDLNTENDAVADYLVKCYGQFIKMGVDGFRIDTSGHISRLTFNHQFIPQFAALGKQYENKRLNKAPFFMYGEVCTRGHEATYRGQANLSCYFYTWKSDESLMNQWDGSQSFWDSQVLPEGSGPVGPQALCGKETFGDKKSENAKMINGAWHEPDYSEASGFNVIDFPMHYSYNTAKDAFRLAQEDELYNDATYNVVYIDSHDYSPGPNDLNRFGGTDAQWAENLSLLFTFRGIPCIYYGSEVGFRRGVRIDPGPNGPLSETGRAYFGGYITGDVTATDFGEYKATGNVAATLNHDVAQHLIRLNKIRQAVPALRKGQWTTDGCKATGKNGIAFKRATKDCYALVALNGGATFTDCPAGTYTDVVTGKTYTGSTIEVEAPSTQGQLRVLVKDWNGGKIGEDGAFIYDTTAKSLDGQDYDGNEEAGTIWNEQGPIQPASVSFSQAGGSFRTEIINLTVTLSEDAKSGWYQIQGQDKVNLTPGVSENLTIGEGMNFGDTKTIEWSAEAQDGKVKSGSLTFKKVDPNASITVYVQAENAPFIYAWSKGSSVKKLTGDWPGTKMTESEEINGEKYWTCAFDGVDNFNVILNNNSGAQSGDITGITGDIYLKYDGGANAQKIDAPVNTAAKVTFSPNGGDFEKTVTVAATLSSNAKSGWYKIGNGEQVALTPGKAATFTLGADMMEGESKIVTWSATNADGITKTGSATFNKIKEVVVPAPTGIFAYFLAPSDWSLVDCWAWNNTDNFTGGNWPGVACTKTDIKKNGLNVWMWKYDGDLTTAPTMIIFNNGGGQQTKDLEFVNGAVYNRDGKTNETITTGINQVGSKKAPAKLKIYSINGQKVAEVGSMADAEYILAPGVYVCGGKKYVIK